MINKLLLLTMIVVGFSLNSTAQKVWNPKHPSWTDSYAANGFCWCDTTYDHNLDKETVTINGKAFGVREICEELTKHPNFRAYRNGDAPYNDIQCGNGPANDAPDEAGCPGRTDLGSGGCNNIGPKWDMQWLSSRTRFKNDSNTSEPRGLVSIKGQSINKYVNSRNGQQPVIVNSTQVSSYQKFTINSVGNGLVSFKGNNGKYLCSENGKKAMNCNRSRVGSWEKFKLVPLGGNSYAIKGNNGKYVSHENGKKPMNCNRSRIGSWEKFTITSLNRSLLVNTADKNVSIYHNPFENNTLTLNVVKTGTVELALVQLINVKGQTILSKQLNVDQGINSISLNTFDTSISPGIYILKVIYQGEQIVKRIFVEK